MTQYRLKHTTELSLSLEAMGFQLPEVEGAHPNAMPFKGVVTRIDEPSDRPPHGAQGHRVMIPRAVAEAKLSTLIGQAVNVADGTQDHNARKKIGVIQEAHINGNDVWVSGYLYAKDFPNEVAELQRRKDVMGMSYEITRVAVADTKAQVWTISDLVFTGAAILEKNAAAYGKTSLYARGERGAEQEDDVNILEELQKINARLDSMAVDGEQQANHQCAGEDCPTCKAQEAGAVPPEFEEHMKSPKDEQEAAKLPPQDDDDEKNAAPPAAPPAETPPAEAPPAEMPPATEMLSDDGMDNLVARLVKAIQTYATQAAQVPPKAEEKPVEAPPAEAPPAEAPPANEAPAEPAPTMEHDDREQDIALLKELVEKLEGGLPKASATYQGEAMDAATEKRLDGIDAKMALLTDTVSKIANKLLTDAPAGKGGELSTDKGENKVSAKADEKPELDAAAAPQRLTKQGLDFAAKFGVVPEEGKKLSVVEIDAALDKQGVKDVRTRMDVKHALLAAGVLSFQ